MRVIPKRAGRGYHYTVMRRDTTFLCKLLSVLLTLIALGFPSRSSAQGAELTTEPSSAFTRQLLDQYCVR